jgi:hypothetical protein
MKTKIDNLTIRRERYGFRVTGYVQSDFLNRELNAVLDLRSPLFSQTRSRNPYEVREAFLKLADHLLEQNKRFDEMAGHLYINPKYPEVNNG